MTDKQKQTKSGAMSYLIGDLPPSAQQRIINDHESTMSSGGVSKHTAWSPDLWTRNRFDAELDHAIKNATITVETVKPRRHRIQEWKCLLYMLQGQYNEGGTPSEFVTQLLNGTCTPKQLQSRIDAEKAKSRLDIVQKNKV